MILSELFQAYRTIPPLDREVLATAALGKSRASILSYPDQEITKVQAKKLASFLKRREQHEPVAYILGQKEFYGRLFLVNRATLIPRPETELLAEEVLKTLALDFCDSGRPADVIDVGTGSGNIITTLVLEHACSKNHLSFFACDRERKALNVAKKNAQRYMTGERISFSVGNLLEPLIKKDMLRSPALIIVANLPYVSRSLFRKISRDIRDYEPPSALLSGKKGLDHSLRLLRMVKKNLSHKRTFLFLEISPEQRIPLQAWIRRLFPRGEVSFLRDLAGRSRLAKISLI